MGAKRYRDCNNYQEWGPKNELREEKYYTIPLSQQRQISTDPPPNLPKIMTHPPPSQTTTYKYSKLPESCKKNYEEKVHKVEDILNNWRNKRLTLIGKNSVIKALAASQLVYVLSSITSCLKSRKETNNLFKFLGKTKATKLSGLK